MTPHLVVNDQDRHCGGRVDAHEPGAQAVTGEEVNMANGDALRG